MQPVSTFQELTDRLGGRRTAATIGVFDGVHLGHQALITQTVEMARASETVAVAITFANHPLSVLAPPYMPRMLVTSARKAALLFEAGMDEVLMLDFTREFAKTPPEEFIQQNLVRLARVQDLVCGYDFTFGSRGSGTIELLSSQGTENGFTVTSVDPVSLSGQIVKSTHIRDLLTSGKVSPAANLLTRPHEVPGVVVSGYQRGRTIGFPTANLQPPEHYQWPGIGVYVCAARVDQADELWPAMVNVGKNPTFGNDDPTIEAHLLDFDRDINGSPLTLYFLERLRDEQKFAGVDDLVNQLREDRRQTIETWGRADILELVMKIPPPLIQI